MNADDLLEMIKRNEGTKLDFKRKYDLEKNSIDTLLLEKEVQSYVNGQWNELIKDIISLTNGNVGFSTEIAYLIVGVGDQLKADGTRDIYDTSYLKLDSQKILNKVNSNCVPPIPDIKCDSIEADGKTVYVISIPPTPYLHETDRRIETFHGNYDASGKLVSVKPKIVYNEYTAFIRKGENNSIASNQERKSIEQDKRFEVLALNLEIQREITENLTRLFGKSGGKITNLLPAYHAFKYEKVIKLRSSIEINYSDSFVLTYLWLQSTVTLDTQFLDYAMISGKYISYDPIRGNHERTKLLERLQDLQLKIRSLHDLKNNPIVDEFINMLPSDKRGFPVKVEALKMVGILGKIDVYEDVMKLSIAIIKYLSGDTDVLSNITLNPKSPFADEHEKMLRERPTSQEILDWIQSNNL